MSGPAFSGPSLSGPALSGSAMSCSAFSLLCGSPLSGLASSDRAIWSASVRSCNVRSCSLVHCCHILQCQVLHFQRHLHCCFYYAAARYTWKSELAVVDFDWRYLIAKPSTRTFIRCKHLGDIYCTSRGITHFVSNFVAMATRVVWGKIQLATFNGHFRKLLYRCKKYCRYLLHKSSYI